MGTNPTIQWSRNRIIAGFSVVLFIPRKAGSNCAFGEMLNIAITLALRPREIPKSKVDINMVPPNTIGLA